MDIDSSPGQSSGVAQAPESIVEEVVRLARDLPYLSKIRIIQQIASDAQEAVGIKSASPKSA